MEGIPIPPHDGPACGEEVRDGNGYIYEILRFAIGYVCDFEILLLLEALVKVVADVNSAVTNVRSRKTPL